MMNIMNRRTMLTMTTLAFLWLGIALPPSDVLGQQKTLKELIVGAWILHSVYDQTEDGVKHEPWCVGVKGIAMFDENGHYSWQIMAAGRPKSEGTILRTPFEFDRTHPVEFNLDRIRRLRQAFADLRPVVEAEPGLVLQSPASRPELAVVAA